MLTAYLATAITLRDVFGHGWPAVVLNSALVFMIASVSLTALYVTAAAILDYRRLSRQPAAYLELTPPAFTDKSPLANEQWLTVLHGLSFGRSWTDRLLRRKVSLSLEMASSEAKGIRYIARVPAAQVAVFTQAVIAHLPDVRLKEIKDYLPHLDQAPGFRLLDFKLAHHFAYPLGSHDKLHLHDPVVFLTNAMTKLGSDELVALQLVMSPTESRSAYKIRNKILNGNETGLNNGVRGWFLWLLLGVLRLAMGILRTILEGIGEIVTGIHPSPKQYQAKQNYGPKVVSPAAQQLIDTINGKLSQPLFRVSLRALVLTNDKQRAAARINGLRSSLSVFNVPGLQAITARSSFPNKLKAPYRLWQYTHRVGTLLQSNSLVLSASELASLYHFPHSVSARTENVVKSLSHSLPAPVSLKTGTKYDVILGQNVHQGSLTPIGLTEDERQRHVYIVGGTGNGKTTLLLYAIMQDIYGGKGLAVVDPHGDLAKTILAHIPKDRINDVIYLNPRDLDYPIGLNLLELPEGLSGSDLEQEKDLVTEAVISVLRKTFSEDDSGGHRIEYVLRNTIHTAMTVEGATIFTVLQLLTDSAFRNPVVQKLKDKDLKNFWKEELGKAGPMQRVKMSAGVTAKIGRFRRSVAAERMLGQAKSTIDFDDILNSGKILICNFSKGKLGEDTSTLFGTTVLAKLQLAALRREELDPAKRRPFYLYVDEFQDFATMPFLQMLSEARKYRLFLTMAEQSTAQQEHFRFVNVILANVGTVICFRSGSPSDEQLLLPLFKPYIDEGAISNLPSYNFYIRLSAVKPQEPFSGETLLLVSEGSDQVSQKVIEVSRQNYATIYGKAESAELENSGLDTDADQEGGHQLSDEPMVA